MPNLLTALDMHIEVLQGLQKIDSFQQDSFLPEEIDLHLNKQQDRFVEQIFNQDFQDLQVRMDYVKNLVVKDYQVKTYQNSLREDSLYGILPSNYLHLISDSSKVVTDTENCTGDFPLVNYTLDDITEYRLVVPFPAAIAGTTTQTYYIGFRIIADNGAPSGSDKVLYSGRFDVNPSNLSQGSTITAAKDIAPIVKDVFDNINVNLMGEITRQELYWERYEDLYSPGAFIFVHRESPTFGNLSADLQFLLNGTRIEVYNEASAVNNTTRSTLASTTGHKLYTENLAITTLETKWVENKLAEGDVLHDFQKNDFYKPIYREPHSTLAGNRIHVYKNKNFIITGLSLDYVRKPKQISLSLDQGCELAGTAPRLIVDQTVEYLKLLLENPAYQGMVQDNQIRNQNTVKNV